MVRRPFDEKRNLPVGDVSGALLGVLHAALTWRPRTAICRFSSAISRLWLADAFRNASTWARISFLAKRVTSSFIADARFAILFPRGLGYRV